MEIYHRYGNLLYADEYAKERRNADCVQTVVKVQREGRARENPTAARRSHVSTGIDMHAREDDANLP